MGASSRRGRRGARPRARWCEAATLSLDAFYVKVGLHRRGPRQAVGLYCFERELNARLPARAIPAKGGTARTAPESIATRRSPLLSKWPIRNKLLCGIGLLLVIVATLSWSGFHSVYAYRSAVRSLRGRADELPLAQKISRHASQLRLIVARARATQAIEQDEPVVDGEALAQRFGEELDRVGIAVDRYRTHLEASDPDDSQINDTSEERETVPKVEKVLAQIVELSGRENWLNDPLAVESVHVRLERLQQLSWELPSYLHERFHFFASEARSQYRAIIFLTAVTTISSALMLMLFIRLCYAWVFRPLRELVKGSRRVAAGEFGYRIALDTRDEMAELADAMNEMTARFRAIRDDLDRQVQQRTRQVVRSEQLASVGFLAAGVAHEINNPLAAIALGAESLESRIAELLESGEEPAPSDRDVIRSYLRMIQTEAFRCKGITERLLDFSRMGDRTRSDNDLRELVQGVIDIVSHLGRHREARIELVPGEPLLAPVNPQELKQVTLNLITNALDSLSPGGLLKIELRAVGDQAEMTFTDNGCGMTDEVLEHLFEPFFTRRRGGQGTGLGLSITFRIVADHGGHIEAHSDGPDKGSRFRVTLPLAARQKKETRHRYQAA
jgi:two-component system, NtrC family, sensor kinase